ncbi:hypothetical protein HY995_00550 [Candidatus Micrarchaeota archaeon]|nr:hypothetical protein [Candidatus Micrarchaeota archaeon]MBI5176557.1 hypothetical protein [Candidatus Micrarchaeota archaeon]
MKVRTTLMLDDSVVRKLQSETDNMSAFVNIALRRALFGEKKSMFGAFKGRVGGKDKIEDDD